MGKRTQYVDRIQELIMIVQKQAPKIQKETARFLKKWDTKDQDPWDYNAIKPAKGVKKGLKPFMKSLDDIDFAINHID